jgi:hypothetical protein
MLSPDFTLIAMALEQHAYQQRQVYVVLLRPQVAKVLLVLVIQPPDLYKS